MTQLTLDWPHPPALGRADYLVSDANAAALAWIERWPDWPGRGLVLFGPSGSGKTHLARLWCRRVAARLVDGADIRNEALPNILSAAPNLVAIDNAERADEAALLHLYNSVTEREGNVLVVATLQPGSWTIALPDLASRLRALPAAGIVAPDEALLAAVLVKHFADRQLRVAPEVIVYLIPRMERSFAAAAALSDRLDRMALGEGGAVTIPLARRLLGDMDQPRSSDLTVT
jgi:chromosomal replication initiation ATPase DnaA